jgi:DNA-3-methyladenine glycosylase II
MLFFFAHMRPSVLQLTFGNAKFVSRAMVTLRSRQMPVNASAQSNVPPPAAMSIARGFTHLKSAAAASTVAMANGKKIKQETVATPRKRARVNSTDGSNGAPSTSSAGKAKTVKKESVAAVEEESRPLLSREEVCRATTIDYPTLPFSLDEAIEHLRRHDVRFHSLLDKVELKPFMELVEGRVRDLDLFKTLATSILGQQVSWLAARVIVYRFVRLFFPDLPEKPDFDQMPREALPFPHPIDVCQSDDQRLRSAGLSGAKVKYVKDVAQRFSDGRLDARKIITLSEEECIAKLVQIKGVGRWTAEMLLMFALRRGNILPVGDLGVQRGMVLFFTSGPHGPTIADKKRKQKNVKKETAEPSVHDPDEKVTTVEDHLTDSQVEVEHAVAGIEQHQTGPQTVLPTPPEMASDNRNDTMLPSLPAEISAATLKSRREGKKAKGNVYLTPAEMEILAAPWAPFRSIAVYMMWALVD